MTTTPQPRVVFIVDQVDRERMDYDDSYGLLDRQDLAFVPIPLQANAPTWQQDLERRGQLVLNNVLIGNPMFPRDYIAAGEADWVIASTKASVFSELCQLLGAQSVEVELLREESKSHSQEFHFKAGKPVGPSVKASGSRSAAQSLVSGMTLGDRFAGGPPELEAAQELLRRTGLDGDQSLARLLRSRAHETNRHSSSALEINLSTEATRTLQAAAKVSIPLYLNFNTDLTIVVREASKFTAVYRVSFG